MTGRTKSKVVKGRRFEVDRAAIERDLANTMKKMGVVSYAPSVELYGNKEARVRFQRDSKKYEFKCSKYGHHLDNFRAVQLTIEYLYRATEAYGVENQEVDRVFAGFLAAPSGEAGEAWFTVLGVAEGAGADVIKAAYRAHAKQHHPDAGGDTAMFQRIQRAYEEGLKARSS